VTATALTDERDAPFGRGARDRKLCLVLVAAITFTLVLQLHLAWTLEINWDEFHYLALVHEYSRRELTLALQTFHVHLFTPLLWLSGDEIRQVEIGRTVMLALECGTMALLYRFSRSFFSAPIALLVVLAYATSGNVMIHGASFRADPLATFLIFAGLAAIGRTRPTVLTTGVAIIAPATALLVTIKVVFYAPAFLAVLLWQLRGARDRMAILRRWVAIAIISTALFGLAYWLHHQLLNNASNNRSTAMLANAASVTLLDANFFPRAGEVVRHVLQDPLQTLLWLAGAGLAVGVLFRSDEEDKGRPLTLLLLAAVAASFLVYRNAFPYFFPFILPPTMLLVGYAIERRKGSTRLLIVVGLALVISSFLSWNRVQDRDQSIQQATLDTVHMAFHRPVATIDRNGMIASFPRVGFFMSTWGLQNYHAAGFPVFGEILAERPVPLLVLNSPTLEDAMGEAPTARLHGRLLPEDRALLHDNYIPHAGKVWVAGKAVEAGPRTRVIVVAVPGQYRLEADAPAVINGIVVQPDHVARLERGSNTLTSAEPQALTLRWADAGPRPDHYLPNGTVYKGF
jgi:hypothetical protein